MSTVVERLREQSQTKQGEAWRRQDGGQDLSVGAQLADDAADLIEELLAALKDAINQLEHSGYCHDHPGLNMGRAAVAKAEGTP